MNNIIHIITLLFEEMDPGPTSYNFKNVVNGFPSCVPHLKLISQIPTGELRDQTPRGSKPPPPRKVGGGCEDPFFVVLKVVMPLEQRK